MVVDLDLTHKYEPIEGWCVGCGNVVNFFVYTNESRSKYKAGCCLCDKYGDVKDTSFKAVLSWSKKFLYVEKRF